MMPVDYLGIALRVDGQVRAPTRPEILARRADLLAQLRAAARCPARSRAGALPILRELVGLGYPPGEASRILADFEPSPPGLVPPPPIAAATAGIGPGGGGGAP